MGQGWQALEDLLAMVGVPGRLGELPWGRDFCSLPVSQSGGG